jgi:ribose/xylose/arabinose/galactoside ABC-type transport system permease subunit
MIRTDALTRFALRRAAVLIALALLAVVLLRVPAFRRTDAWVELLHANFSTALLALALTPVILTGGIDLSVGSVTVFSAVVIGVLSRDAGWPIGWALAGGVLAGLLAGVANGLLVTVGVMPLVATLATRELFRGLALTLSRNQPVDEFPEGLEEFWRTPLWGLPLPLYGILGVFVLTYVVVQHTWVGRMIYAVGDNEQAARFAGVPVRGVKLGLYAWCGLVAGVCGVATVLEYEDARAGADQSLELAAIACVVLGGVRITGGAGHVAGTLLGIVTLTTLLGGLVTVAARWRDTITGGLLLVVALVNEAAARYGESRAAEPAAPGPRS